ncbi:MAG TPA: hypothetical protein PK293_16825 [Spirochaetota bacterium]|nr:hypothetical protein [Spirochaetota bacterium]
MKDNTAQSDMNLICVKCEVALSIGKVTLEYMGNSFPVDLYKCPKCGLVYIPEDLALGKMNMAEKALEDK